MNDSATVNSEAPASEVAMFVRCLLAEGRAMVFASPPDLENDDALPVLQELDVAARMELGLDAPAFSPAAALWGARLFYQLCQFVICRDIGEAQVAAACAVSCPVARGPETDWSVDLMFRHLPKLFQLARQLSNGDPLVQQIKQLGRAWPLSSVSMPDLGELRLESFIVHPSLWRLYTDRIMAATDVSRLGDPRVDELLRADLGVHHALSPALAAKLFVETP